MKRFKGFSGRYESFTNLIMTEFDNDTLQSAVFQYFVITVWMKSS